MNDELESQPEEDYRGKRKEEAVKSLAFIEAELAQLDNIPAETWNRLHAAFEQVRAAL